MSIAEPAQLKMERLGVHARLNFMGHFVNLVSRLQGQNYVTRGLTYKDTCYLNTPLRAFENRNIVKFTMKLACEGFFQLKF